MALATSGSSERTFSNSGPRPPANTSRRESGTPSSKRGSPSPSREAPQGEALQWGVQRDHEFRPPGQKQCSRLFEHLGHDVATLGQGAHVAREVVQLLEIGVALTGSNGCPVSEVRRHTAMPTKSAIPHVFTQTREMATKRAGGADANVDARLDAICGYGKRAGTASTTAMTSEDQHEVHARRRAPRCRR